MNKYNAARAAGYSESVAKSHTIELEKRVKIADILERKGLTDDVLVEKHKQLLEAHSLVIIDGKVIYEEKGGVKRPEYQVQVKALELAYKLKDLLKDKELSIDNSSHYHFTTLKGDALINEARRKGITLPVEIERRLGANGFSKQVDVVHP